MKQYRIGSPIVKVQNQNDTFLLENPIFNFELDGEFSISNQLLLTLEYLGQYRSDEPSYFFNRTADAV